METQHDFEAALEFFAQSGSASTSPPLAPPLALPGTWPQFLMGQTDQPVRVLLIDDDPHMSRVIAHELLGDLRINLLGKGRSVREGRRLISEHEFDVMLVDLNLGDGTGFELIERMKTVRPLAEAVVITAMEDEQHALHAFELGATGYTSPEIGTRLTISGQTVNAHIKNIFRKLSARNRAQAVSFATDQGLLN